ncbi:MAG: hypothetical protein JST00_06575 [Deltaproteobacteria bacterium]|nr:hypothetical protein [Deltaproteobacteria bacterium]
MKDTRVERDLQHASIATRTMIGLASSDSDDAIADGSGQRPAHVAVAEGATFTIVLQPVN